MFIDVHCHLNLLDDIEGALVRARDKGVGCIVTQGVNTTSNRLALDHSAEYKEVKAALGLYPSDLEKMPDKSIDKEIEFIRENKDKIAAVGEVGLDLKEAHDFEKQRRAFNDIIALAVEIDKPIIVHSRKAELECMEMLEKGKAKKVVMHCFSGKLTLVKRIIENKWYLSIPGSILKSEHFQQLVRMTPIEHLLCETDSPYLHPEKEFPNEPCNVIVSYEMIAKIKGLKLKDVEKQIEGNYKRLFQTSHSNVTL